MLNWNFFPILRAVYWINILVLLLISLLIKVANFTLKTTKNHIKEFFYVRAICESI